MNLSYRENVNNPWSFICNHCLAAPTTFNSPNVRTYLVNNLFPFVLSLAPVPLGPYTVASDKKILQKITSLQCSHVINKGRKRDCRHTGYAFYYNNLITLMNFLQEPSGLGLVEEINTGNNKKRATAYYKGALLFPT
jgi:hypothetical protein